MLYRFALFASKPKLTNILFALIVLALSACTSAEDIQILVNTRVAQTMQISQLETAAAGASTGLTVQDTESVDSQESPNEENVASATLLPQDTATSTQDIPTVRVTRITNCRTGPAVFYAFLNTAEIGVDLIVLGLPADPNIAEYAIIRNPNGNGTCWLWLRYADKTDFSAYDLPTYNTPPTPTPSNTPKPSKTPTSTLSPTIDLSLTATSTPTVDLSATSASTASPTPTPSITATP
jgi:hypothetical protein